MKKWIPFFLILLCGCETNPSPLVQHYEVFRKDDHLGEYLQRESSESLITVNREGAIKGLVRVSLKTNEIETLDPLATEAKDILLNAGKLIYRINRSVYLRSNDRKYLLPIEAKKLRTFVWHEADMGRVTYDSMEGVPKWMTVRDSGDILASGELPGSARASIIDNANKELLVFQNDEGFELGIFKDPLHGFEKTFPVEKGKLGSFANMISLDGGILIAYLDESKGVLKTAQTRNHYGSFDIRLVDGIPNETFVGMDMAFFTDRNFYGLIYLDAWNLKLRMARLIDSKWTSQELPIKGAVGFYTQVLEATNDKIKIAFHNFRSDYPIDQSSFEDLAIAEIRLNQ